MSELLDLFKLTLFGAYFSGIVDRVARKNLLGGELNPVEEEEAVFVASLERLVKLYELERISKEIEGLEGQLAAKKKMLSPEIKIVG